MTPDPTRLPRLLATAERPDLGAHLEQWGRRPHGRSDLIAEIDRCRLAGRGGAGFPAAVKWSAPAGRTAAVVVNATEGEPASLKDRVLLQHAPHLVLDGASVAAEVLGAAEVVVCVDQAATGVIRVVSRALAERARHRQDRVAIRLEMTPSGYVTGEETALVQWLNGGDAKPTFGSRPYEKGVGGRPTLVHNPETLAHVALIARFGADWFGALGTAAGPGTTLVTVGGDVGRPAVYEIALGTPLADVVASAAPSAGAQAVLLGGYAGTWLPGAVLAGTGLDAAQLQAHGASLGCGAVVVLGEQSCGLAATAAIADWMAAQSAGQCGPCVHGLPTLADAVGRLLSPGAPQRWGSQIERWMWMIAGRGACKHPDGVVRMVRSGLEVFAADTEAHRRHGTCGRSVPPLALPLASRVPA